MASANVLNISDADFQKVVLESDIPVLLDFTAVWCGPCKAIAPLLDQLADAQKGKLKVVKMDVDHNPQTPSRFGVQNIPTLILFRNGREEARRVGSLSRAALDSWVAPALGG